MTKFYNFAVLVALLISSFANAEIYSCSGHVIDKPTSRKVPLHISIYISEGSDFHVGLYSEESNRFIRFIGDGDFNTGELQIQLGSTKPFSLNLVITSLPNDEYHLRGFALGRDEIHVVRSEFWDKPKKLYYYSTFISAEEVIELECDSLPRQ